MSDLELLQAIEALAKEIAMRPVKRWHEFVIALMRALDHEFFATSLYNPPFLRKPGSRYPDLHNDLYQPVLQRVGDRHYRGDYDRTAISFRDED